MRDVVRNKENEKGAISFEAALVLPIVLIFLLVVFQNVVHAQTASAAAQAAADETARAASIQQTKLGGRQAANAVLLTSHNNEKIACGSLQVLGDFQPGSIVRTSVECTVAGGSLSKSVTYTKRGSEVVDPFRSVE